MINFRMMATITKTDAQLKEAAVDVAYEFKMFNLASRRLDRLSPSLGHNNSMVSVPLALPASAASSFSTANNSAPVAPVPISPWQASQQAANSPGDLLDIEALLLHFRNLMEFFYTKSLEKDNLVLAHHYHNSGPLPKRPWAHDFNIRCNNLLAHLTYFRSDKRRLNEHHWCDILEKVRYMEEEIVGFLDSLTPERKEWFK